MRESNQKNRINNLPVQYLSAIIIMSNLKMKKLKIMLSYPHIVSEGSVKPVKWQYCPLQEI